MKIIMTPAKNVKAEVDCFAVESQPVFLTYTQTILSSLQQLSAYQLQKILKCSPRLAQKTYETYQHMNLCENQVPAFMAFKGIQFDHLAGELFSYEEYDYIRRHIVILSGFYGILRPFDGIVPYRLELNTPVRIGEYRNLYQFWNRIIYDQLIKDDHQLLDLGGKQYSRMIHKYLDDSIQYVQCRFKEKIAGKLVEKGVYVNMARGEMIRYLVKHQISDFAGVRSFDMLGYRFDSKLSTKEQYIFVRGR